MKNRREEGEREYRLLKRLYTTYNSHLYVYTTSSIHRYRDHPRRDLSRSSRVRTYVPHKFEVAFGAPVHDPAVWQALKARSIRLERKSSRAGSRLMRCYFALTAMQLYIQSENHHF